MFLARCVVHTSQLSQLQGGIRGGGTDTEDCILLSAFCVLNCDLYAQQYIVLI